MEFISKNLNDTAQIASDFAKKITEEKENQAKITGLYGELGSGKTTFMKFLAESLGIKETIQSPTFVIMKIYNLASVFKKLIHIDAYRIENPKEMEVLNWKEIISNPENIIFIEWPEKISEIMPPHIQIFFEHISENERKIEIK